MSSIGAEATTTLDEEAICFPFGAIITIKIFEKIEKSLKLL